MITVFIALLVFLPGMVFAGGIEPPPEAVDGSGNPVGTMHTLEEIYRLVAPLPTGFVLWEDNTRFALWDGKTPTDTSDDVILDRSTGLMWVRNVSTLGQKNWEDAVSQCDFLDLGNRKDWSLPTIEELVTLMENYYSVPPFPNGHPFVNIPSGSYWSGTSVEGSTINAWYVAYHGSVNTGSKGVSLWVLPVRGGN